MFVTYKTVGKVIFVSVNYWLYNIQYPSAVYSYFLSLNYWLYNIQYPFAIYKLYDSEDNL